MIVNDLFEIVEVADEFIAIPVGELSDSFQGVVVLNEEAVFLLKCMKVQQSIDDLIVKLCDEFEVESSVARKDIVTAIDHFRELGLVID